MKVDDYQEQHKDLTAERGPEKYLEEDKDMFPPTNTEEFSAMMNPVSLPKTKFEEMFNGLKTG